MPSRPVRNRVSTHAESSAAQAYLLTITEAYGDRPIYGDTFLSEVITAFRTPAELRAVLPEKLRPRYDWWLTEITTEQYELFQE